MRKSLTVLILLLALLSFGAHAQQSVETLPPPGPVSSGETAPGAAAADTAAEQAAEAGLPQPPAPPCGTQPITIARMAWPSAALLAEIHARLLAEQFGCMVTLQSGDLAATASAMGATGQPAVAPEMWVTRVADIWNSAMQGQKVRQAGVSYDEALFEGWFVPDYVVERWGDIDGIAGVQAHIGEFAPAGERPRFISCPPDWACALINRNMLRAYGLEARFDIVEPGNRFEMDTLIAEAVGRREPFLFYYWQPNAVLAQFAFRSVALNAYDKDAFACMGRSACAAATASGFAPDPVVVAVAEWVYLEAPQVAAYFARARMPFAEMNRMLQQLGEPGATIEPVAQLFVAEHGEIWRPWAGLPAVPAEVPAAQ
jgi:glycine betaine/proline transport system substrate-binding protein